MKKAFTLIELMITIAVLAILMGLVFRLSSMGSDSYNRNRTIARLQKVENCLSGYMAAFGSYPPVKLHGVRDIYYRTDVRGLQTDDRNENIWGWTTIGTRDEQDAWAQVKAACRSQPVDCRYPYPENYSEIVDTVSQEMKRRADSGDDLYKAYWSDETVRKRLSSGFDDGVTRNKNRLAGSKNKSDWRNIQIFKFGLLSYLLPRYLVMMNGPEEFFSDYAQWTGSNTLPSNPLTGTSYSMLGGWKQVKRDANSTQKSDLAKIANMPSQAVCARWMPNLAGACKTNHKYTLFGIDIRDSSERGDLDPDSTDIEVYTPAGASGATSFQDPYVLDGVSIRDGWGTELFYYSPAPYQKYVLWSAGPNGRTFPPWISRKRLSSKANECVGKWTHDDIVHMSN